FEDRFHTDLSAARVIAFNSSVIMFETLVRARQLKEWKTIIARNRWFQRKVVGALKSQPSTLKYQPIFLSYSYAALEPFRFAKLRGWKTLLFQIDPGPEEERIVSQEVARVPALAGEWHAAPADYWASWRQECDFADRIIVNSEWSREGLIRSGIPSEKVTLIPLAYGTSEVGDKKSEIRQVRSFRLCGGVGENGRNGIFLQEPSAAFIAAAIRDCVAHPNRLQALAAVCYVQYEFTTAMLGQRLQELGSAL